MTILILVAVTIVLAVTGVDLNTFDIDPISTGDDDPHSRPDQRSRGPPTRARPA